MKNRGSRRRARNRAQGRSQGKAQRSAQRDGRNRQQHAPALLKATVDKNRKGFAFLIFDRSVGAHRLPDLSDIFVSPREARGLFHGDRVEVRISASRQVQGIRLLAHRFRELVGRFSPDPRSRGRAGWVIYERKRAREEIYVPHVSARVAENDWVRAKLRFGDSEGKLVTGDVVEVYGAELPPSADIGMVAGEFNLVEEHPEDAEREARALGAELGERETQGRRDLRELPLITIDGETARDFDDAVYVERRKSGYVLWVAIADVSHYVREGMALDRDARARGTSVYFPEKAFHMLPRALSESLCSLRPHEPRLALVAKMGFDRDGKREQTEILEALIESKRRATYNEIEAEADANSQESGRDPKWEYAPHFELYRLLRKARTERGSIDFDLPEAEVQVKPTGEVISIRERPRLDSHRLIEEFMIAANEAVTEWMMERKWPFVYRVHEEPSAEALERFQALAASVGFKFSLEGAPNPRVLAAIVRKLEGHPGQALLNTALLRSMKQAVYSSTHGIHYGLASAAYTHFTSPIRRYPDLLVHRMLRRAAREEARQEPALGREEREKLEKDLAAACEHCSYRERLAADAEREAVKLKQVRAMRERLGDELDGRIVGMTETGFFVQISDPYCEGMVSKDTLLDDVYEFNEQRMVFFGRRKKRTFRVGDSVRVVCDRADIDRRQIDFSLA